MAVPVAVVEEVAELLVAVAVVEAVPAAADELPEADAFPEPEAFETTPPLTSA